MKINKYVDKEWFRRWWKDFRLVLWFALALLALGVIAVVGHLIVYPPNYSLEDTGSFTGKCYKIDTQTKEVFSAKYGWHDLEFTVLHMSDGQTYFLSESLSEIFNVSTLNDNIDDKNITIRYDLKKEDLGYLLRQIEDEDGNIYLSLADLKDSQDHSRISMSLFIVVAILFVFISFGWIHYSILFDHIRENIRKSKRREQKKERQLARQQRFLEDPESFKNAKNKK